MLLTNELQDINKNRRYEKIFLKNKLLKQQQK